MRLAAHLDVAGKMPLTDFCNRHFRLEHPTPIARLPSPQPFSRGDRLLPAILEPFFLKKAQKLLGEHGVGPPFGNPAPGEATLDGAAPASARSFTFLPS